MKRKLVYPSSRANTTTTRKQQPLSFDIPAGFVLLQDNREQSPLFLSPRAINSNLEHTGVGAEEGLEVHDCTVHNGDYSIQGLEHLFAIERKGLSDLHSYCGREREAKTIPKMERFKQMVDAGGWVGLVIEASEQSAWLGPIQSKMHPNQIRGNLVGFEVRYGVHIFYSSRRDELARWVLDRAIKFYKVRKELTE